MKKSIVLSAVVAATSLACASASAMDILARVISSTPVVQQVSVPRQVCTTQPMITESPRSGAGAMMGALAGGAMGNAVGDGGGRAIATMIGLVGGAIIGNNIEGPNQQLQNVQQCGMQTSYENRTSHYNVVYEYASKQYTVQMLNDPGHYVRLQVTPVGAVPAPQPNVQQGYVQPYQPQVQQMQQAYPQQPVYVQPAQVQPVYVQQAPVVVYPGYYSRPYYPPIGMSINFGYSRGGHYRHRHHGHWR
ncbi:MAG TPA: hypothetical protein VE934_14230 [Polaromonas sp.]|uniref:glycine zipper 2TM domain-containing protein n=1 Tax=Polaromonas sp. TaxID=1869339 RepID=UPI002D24E57A|nr:hypothetical protein [Polaromonas sp.]HYW58113.1 hypothetical protein [Polaromonas sp.]